MKPTHHIRKVRGGFRVFGNKKTKGGKLRNFGTYRTRAAAKRRQLQVQYFKYGRRPKKK